MDINNISRVSCETGIFCDDKGYPVCDKSVEALSLMERKLLGLSLDKTDPLLGAFFDSARMKEVQAIEKIFHQSGGASYPVC